MLCGKKTAIFFLLISIWGTIQLSLMGIFYAMKSVALIEDIPVDENYSSLEDFQKDSDEAFQAVAVRCFVTAVIYLCTAIICFICLRRNRANERRQLMQQQQQKAQKEKEKMEKHQTPFVEPQPIPLKTKSRRKQ
ncbi:uncharacterized protein Dwil_GK19636 [Drosophila willistoni]|uniref:Uncharacterized protein n=2 Tax=Drosophila willistoni TaxID=7260 RepID=B4MNT1_DROWI|nr:uncharacterized protein Dwil_GK19636 [Drosophila willistoni]